MSGPEIKTRNGELDDETIVCENCGSYKVQVKQWVWVNGGGYAGPTEGGQNDHWCDTCETHSDHITYAEYKERDEQ